MLSTRVLGFPQAIEIDKRPAKIQGRFGVPAIAGGNENKKHFPLFACSLRVEGDELVPYKD